MNPFIDIPALVVLNFYDYAYVGMGTPWTEGPWAEPSRIIQSETMAALQEEVHELEKT